MIAGVICLPARAMPTRATGLVPPQLAGRPDGIALRVPVPHGSVVDLRSYACRIVELAECVGATLPAAEPAG